MKKTKRILALLGVVLLLALYLITFITAFFDQADSMSMFKASVLATILIPVLLWAYSFVYRMVRSDRPDFSDVTASGDSTSGDSASGDSASGDSASGDTASDGTTSKTGKPKADAANKKSAK